MARKRTSSTSRIAACLLSAAASVNAPPVHAQQPQGSDPRAWTEVILQYGARLQVDGWDMDYPATAGRATARLLLAAAEWASLSVVQAQQVMAGDPWLGTEVILQYGARLQLDGQDVEHPKIRKSFEGKEPLEFGTYQILKVDGPRLWLDSGFRGVQGWVPADRVVPVERAVEYITDRIHANPEDPFNYLWRGSRDSLKNEFEKAIEDFSEAIRRDPLNKLAHTARGQAWYLKGDHDRALVDLNEAIRLDPSYARPYLDRGNVRQARGESDKAINDWTMMIRLAPDYYGPYLNRGNEWEMRGEYDKAIADLDEAIRLEPESVPAYIDRGNAWKGKKQYDKAMADYNEAIRIDPRFVLSYVQRGLCRSDEKKDHDGALADCDRAIQLDPGFALAYIDRGIFRGRKKDYRAALADFDEAIRIAPKFSPALSSRAWFLATCPDATFRDGKKALADAEQACALTGYEEPGGLASLAAAHAELRDFDRAAAFQARANTLTAAPEARSHGEKALKLYQARQPHRSED
jgi:tetratricopeptide (TPR) repeat protein